MNEALVHGSGSRIKCLYGISVPGTMSKFNVQIVNKEVIFGDMLFKEYERAGLPTWHYRDNHERSRFSLEITDKHCFSDLHRGI